MIAYFLDTYAMVEIVNGNPKFNRFLSEKIFTSLYNLYELYYVILRNNDEFIAKKVFNSFKSIIIEIKDEYIFNASKFKLNNTKKRLSYVDCLGYIMANDLNLKFLTGDKEFENIKNVEFVKK